jgi:hypothetical protein
MDDIRIEGMISHFDATTPEYDVEFWVEQFVHDVFYQERIYFLSGLEKQPIFDESGRPISATKFRQKVEIVWEQLPVTKHVGVKPIATQVADEEGAVTAVISWHNDEDRNEVESFFRLQPSPYTGWDVVQTTLLDDLLTFLS